MQAQVCKKNRPAYWAGRHYANRLIDYLGPTYFQVSSNIVRVPAITLG